MALDPRFFPAPSLQDYFVDKQTGLPLSFGLVFFYEDESRTVLKPIFTLSGSPPNYTYTQLPNPVVLSGVGTVQDGNGNDVILYYFPFDANGNVELYYIVVKDQFGTVQFTRQGFPNESELTPAGLNFSQNFAPNGQFLLNNPIKNPSSSDPAKYTIDYGAGVITNVLDIAPGGWTYEVSSTSTATDKITFVQQTSISTSPPTSSPRYELKIVRSSVSADSICDVRIRFNDVNKFQGNTVPGDVWSFIFAAKSSTALSLDIRLIKYFGTNNGSGIPTTATSDIKFSTGFVNTDPVFKNFSATGRFGVNTGATTGTDNNDFVELAIRIPTATVFDLTLTDFMLINASVSQTDVQSLKFPVTTNGEFVLQALSNLAPTQTANSKLSDTTTNYYNEDGSNLYLPMIMTTSGFTYDYSSIGTIVGKVTSAAFNNELLCDGASYPVNERSPLGIPYKRLFSKLVHGYGGTLFGSGPSFINAVNTNVGAGSELAFIQNQVNLAQTAPADGAVATGFTFNISANTPTLNPNFNFKAYNSEVPISPSVTGISKIVGQPLGGIGISAGTLVGAGALDYIQSDINAVYYYKWILFNIPTGLVLATGGVGLYFDFSNTVARFRMWFNTGTEIAPAAGGNTLVEVHVEPTMTGDDIAVILSAVISNFQTNTVKFTSAATVAAGSYFTFQTNNITYTPWYKVSGAGTEPAVTNPIEVDILSTDNAALVTQKTQFTLNSQFFAVPDLRGVFLRGFDPTLNYDLGLGLRFTAYQQVQPQLSPGSFEVDYFGVHYHTTPQGGGANTAATATGATTLISNIRSSVAGFSETRPFNFNVNWFMKY